MGVAVYGNGIEGLLTADHCAPGKETFWQSGTVYSGVTYAKVGTSLDWNNDGNDVQILTGGDYNGLMFTGGNHSTSKIKVTGSSEPYVGQILYIDGGYSGKRKVKVTKIGSTYWSAAMGRNYLHQVDVKSTSTPEVAVAGQGDSGGPVWYSYKGGAAVVALMSHVRTGTNKDSGLYLRDCAGVPGPRNCSSRAIIAPLHGFFVDHPAYKTIKG